MKLISRQKRLPAMAAVPVLALIVGGGFYMSQKSHLQTQPPGIRHVIAYTTPKPSEKPINKTSYVSTAGPAEPKYITLPTIGAQGFVQKMGIDQNQQIAAPSNVNLAGWYVNSVLPGQTGLSIIDGHVDGFTSPGIFLRLDKLRPGDRFTVERGDGTVLTYQVRTVNAVSVQSAVSVLFSQAPSIRSELNLITCGGTFNRTSKSYEQRIVVTSALVQSS